MSKNYLRTNLLKKQSRSILITLGVIIFSSMIYLSACSKVDDAINSLLDFDGIFSSSDGWKIDLSGSSAEVTEVGTTRSSSGYSLVKGDYVMTGMSRTSDNSWAGTVIDSKFEHIVSGTATINSNVLTVTPVGYPSYSFTKSTGTGTGTGTGTNTDTIYSENMKGGEGQSKWVTITIPKDVKKVEFFTCETDISYWNTADMFVKKGSTAPTVSKIPTYSSNADCESKEVNRYREYCSYDNPTTLTWTILLYGYNSDFSSQLVVVITKK